MPVDREVLKETLREAVGGDGELYSFLEQKLLAQEDLATKFVGGYMRDKDYRTKTQALAEDRRKWEAEAGQADQYKQQVDQYRQLLETAEGEKAKVLRDLGKQKESLQGAYARLQHIKEMYQLSDDDIPTYKDLIDTKAKGKPVDHSDIDIDSKLQALEDKLTKYLAEKLVPELGGMARLPGIFDGVREEHRELTGKKLTQKEHDELLNEAERRAKSGRPVSYMQLWEEKYNVPELRQKQHDQTFEKELRAKWDAEQKARLSEQALQGISPVAPEQQGLRTSNILNHKFQLHEEAPAGAPKSREAPSAADRQALSGADRASRRFLERRANGVPMGAPDERKAPTKVA
jgi:hypothetical protein